MIQDIAPHKLNNQYDVNAKPSSCSYAMHFKNSEILANVSKTGTDFLKAGECENKVSKAGECENKVPGGESFTFLFRIDQDDYYLINDDAYRAVYGKEFQPPEGFEYHNLRKLRFEGNLRPEQAFAAYTARHLSDWYRDTKFCGRCGAVMEHSKIERAMVCPECRYTAYPRIMPAVIVGVKNGDSLLLTRYKNDLGYNALVAGFTEIGETLEETVAREVMEETGIRVKNIRYYKSQPWGIANDLLTGFYCEADGDTKIRVDENELSRAIWTKREDIELQPGTYSLTNEMMTRFKDGKEK